MQPPLPPIVSVAIDSIVVTRDSRQRRDLDPDGLARLAADIARNGLLNPIIVDEDHVLVAGERRLAALRLLKWTHAPVRFWHLLDPRARLRLEWAENAHRSDLPWQDRCNAVAAYHAAACADEPGWFLSQTADELGLARGTVSEYILVAAAGAANPDVWTCTSRRQAYNAIERKFGRELGLVLAGELEDGIRQVELDEDEPAPAEHGPVAVHNDSDAVIFVEGPNSELTQVPPGEQAAVPLRQAPQAPRTILPARWSIHCTSFSDWAAAYTGPPFSVLHLDPPYGIGFVNTGIFRKANALDDFYDDRESDLDEFFDVLADNWRKLVAPSAHIIYWYSNALYTENRTRWETFFQNRSIPARLNPTPLVWHKSNNRGMMSVPERDPRNVYETAFLITVGDQKLARAMGTNVVSEPADPSLHPSAKPLAVVRTWLAGVVDVTSRVLDPTCGHGSALTAALELGAREVVGVELDPIHVARAKVEVATRARELQALETVSL